MKELGINSDLKIVWELDLYRQYNNAIRIQFDFWIICKTIQYTAGHIGLSFLYYWTEICKSKNSQV